MYNAFKPRPVQLILMIIWIAFNLYMYFSNQTMEEVYQRREFWPFAKADYYDLSEFVVYILAGYLLMVIVNYISEKKVTAKNL